MNRIQKTRCATRHAIVAIIILLSSVHPTSSIMMSNKIGTYDVEANSKVHYNYQNLIFANSKLSKRISLVLLNVFDYETHEPSPQVNTAIFGGGRTESLFTGASYSINAFSKIRIQNFALYFYSTKTTRKFYDFIYFDWLNSVPTKIRGLTFSFRTRISTLLYPYMKQDVKELVAMHYFLVKHYLKLTLANEVKINFWPNGWFSSNDMFVKTSVYLSKLIQLYATVNYETRQSNSILNVFTGFQIDVNF